MEIEIYWTYFAKKELNKIFDYYRRKANLKVTKCAKNKKIPSLMQDL